MDTQGESNPPVKFHPLNREAEIQVRARNLPHWSQPGTAIFVTFRTADSMPAEVLQRWQLELEEWLLHAKLPIELADSVVNRRHQNHVQLFEKLSAVQQSEFRRLSNRIFHRCLDECHGECLMRQSELAEIVGNAIRFYDAQRYDLDRFVVMPNHVHAIVQFRLGSELQVVGQSWMRYTARFINQQIGRQGDLWQSEPFDHIIRSPEQFEYLQQYIAANPSNANLKVGEFLYWQCQS